MDTPETLLLERIADALERIADYLESARGRTVNGEGFFKVVVGDRTGTAEGPQEVQRR